MEQKIQEEIRRRRKEKCKLRKEEAPEETQGPVKRRKLEEDGAYKRVSLFPRPWKCSEDRAMSLKARS